MPRRVVTLLTSKSGVLATCFVTLLAAFLCFYQLGAESISLSSDEVIHIRVTQEMLHRGTWWQPTHGGVPYFNKPPLKMWLTFIPVALFGESNFSYRFIDALAGVGTVALLIVLSRRIYGSLWPGIIGGVLLLGCAPWILGNHGARRATQDAMLVLLLTGAILATLRLVACLHHRGRELFVSAALTGALLGAATMTKSVSGLVPLAPIGMFLFIAAPGNIRRRLSFVAGPYAVVVLTALVIPALYYIPHALWTRNAFETFFTREVFERAVVGRHNAGDPYYYVKALLGGGVLPLLLLIPATLLVSYRAPSLRSELTDTSLKHRRQLGEILLLLSALVPIVLYSIPKARLLWYIAPAFPPLALLCGGFAVEMGTAARNHFVTRRSLYVRATCGAVVAVLALVCVQPLARVTSGVLAPKRRLLVDKLVEDIRREGPDARMLMYSKAVSLSANPQKRRFNPEAIYLRMLRERLVRTRDVDETRRRLREETFAYFMTDRELVPLFPSLGPVQPTLSLPPFNVRADTTYVFSLSVDPLSRAALASAPEVAE